MSTSISIVFQRGSGRVQLYNGCQYLQARFGECTSRCHTRVPNHWVLRRVSITLRCNTPVPFAVIFQYRQRFGIQRALDQKLPSEARHMLNVTFPGLSLIIYVTM